MKMMTRYIDKPNNNINTCILCI